MTISPPCPIEDQVLFTRRNLEAISERAATYIMQRSMEPTDAWKLAIEDEAQFIQYKFELIREEIVKPDWPYCQLEAMRLGLQFIGAVERLEATPTPA